jgi:uncharacterized protein (TIGR02147 family)
MTPAPTRLQTPAERPVVFRFLDARAFLTAVFEYEKSRNPKFSHRYVAKALDSSSSGFFKDILNGRVRISPARAIRFARLFGLSSRESEHFEALVQYTQASDAEEKDRWLARMTSGSRARKDTVLEAFQLEYFRKWHYAAVRELLAIYDFRGDHARLAALLDPAITPSEAEDSIRLLLKLKLIRKTAQGRYERVDKVIRSGTQNPARVKPAIRGNLELALRALETHPPAVRPFSYLTLSISEASLVPIRAKLASLRGELLDIVAQDEGVDRLYQLNFQLFPLSKIVKDKKA